MEWRLYRSRLQNDHIKETSCVETEENESLDVRFEYTRNRIIPYGDRARLFPMPARAAFVAEYIALYGLTRIPQTEDKRIIAPDFS